MNVIQPNLSGLSNQERKRLKGLGHHLKPVVIIAGQGLSEGVVAEINRALTDHELIKIRVAVGDRAEREALAAQCCQLNRAQCVAQIGRSLILYRRHPEQKAPHTWAK